MTSCPGRSAIRAAAVALALIVSACASTNDASRVRTSREPAGSTSPERESRATSGGLPRGQATGVEAGAGARQSRSDPGQRSGAAAPSASTSIREPITVGLLYAINDAAEDAGVDNGNTITPSEVVHAFVESYNATGGIAGRRIVPVYASLRSASHDYEAQMQAICATFTEDNHVEVVLSSLGYYSETLLACLARAQVPIISGDWVAPDRQAADRLPLFVTPNTLLGDTRVAAVVKHLTRTGSLQPRHRLGVVIEGCAVDQRVYENGLLPALKRAGLKVASNYEVSCFEAIQDFAEQTSQMSSAVLRFRQQDVDRVMFVSQGAEANLAFAFSTVAEQQGWRPGYALSSVAAPEALALNVPEGQLVNMRGVGWLPVVDSHDRKQSPPTATGRRCLERMKAEGILPASNTDLAFVYISCDTFALYDAVLRSSGGDPSGSAVLRALDKIGSSYISAFTVGGRVTASGGRMRPVAARIFAYTPNSGFRYTTAAFPL